MAYLRDRRAFGNIGTRKFRGARFGDPLSPRFSGLLDQYGGAAAAYSLRALSSGWLAGDVVEVRRSSDGTLQDFTASQITNGDLLTFTGAGDGFVSTWYDQTDPTIALYDKARYFNGINAETSFTGVGLNVGDTLSFSFNVSEGCHLLAFLAGQARCYVSTVDDQLYLDSGTATSQISTTAIVYGQTYSVSVLRVDSSTVETTINGVLVGSTALLGTIQFSSVGGQRNSGKSPIRLKGSLWGLSIGSTFAQSGLGTSVTAWLDTVGSNNGTEVNGTAYKGQGVGNHATQGATTAQPKIVSAGALVVGGLDFDGVDDFLSTSGISTTQPISTFSAFTPSAAIGSIYGSTGHSLFTNATNLLVMNNGTPLISTNSFANGTENVVSAISNSALSSSYVNGVEWASGNSGTNGISGILYVGRLNITGRNLDGLITELIIYPSDQTANRVAIETEIMANYGI